MQEKEFLDNIKCKFPYNDINKGREIVDEALKISDNSIFAVIHELVRPPRSAKYNKETTKDILKYIDSNFEHKFKRELIDISMKSIDGDFITEETVISLMEKVRKYRWLSLPLNILYFLVDDESGNIEKKYNEIIEYWSSSS